MALGFSPESSPSALYTFPSPSSTCCPSVLEPDISLFPPYQQADYAGPSIPNFGHLRAACSPCHQSSRTSRNPKSLSPCPGRRRTRTPSHFTWKTTDQSVPAVDLTATSPVELPSRHSVDRLFESLSPEPHCSQVESCTIPVQLANSSQQKVPTMDSQRWSLPSQAQPSSSQISQSRPSKRRKLESAPSERHTPSSSTHPPPEIESIDLTEVEDKSGLVDALSKQREDAVRAQMDRSGSGNDAARSSLTSYKCPVCMDVLEDATTTICGHLFCHKCIIDTLRFGEERQRNEGISKPKGKCPVCRKPIGRSEKGKAQALIPMELKFVTKSQLKGKEKVHDDGESSFGWEDMVHWDQ